MTEKEIVDELLRAAIQVLGRIAVKPEDALAIVGEKRKFIKAFNPGDGHQTQKEVVNKTGLGRCSFSKTSARRAANGVALMLGDAKEAAAHAYIRGQPWQNFTTNEL